MHSMLILQGVIWTSETVMIPPLEAYVQAMAVYTLTSEELT